jgi:electron transfer flavoprotein alpha subunit
MYARASMQHIVECKNSKTIIVINTDPEAPIMAYADYAIIGTSTE